MHRPAKAITVDGVEYPSYSAFATAVSGTDSAKAARLVRRISGLGMTPTEALQAEKTAKLKPQPRFPLGHKIGHLVVMQHVDFGPYHPETRKHLSKKHHWYRLQCQCGALVVLNQDQLRDRIDCDDCLEDRRSRNVAESKRGKIEAVPVELDFARLKW